jgi:hypothetical protein
MDGDIYYFLIFCLIASNCFLIRDFFKRDVICTIFDYFFLGFCLDGNCFLIYDIFIFIFLVCNDGCKLLPKLSKQEKEIASSFIILFWKLHFGQMYWIICIGHISATITKYEISTMCNRWPNKNKKHQLKMKNRQFKDNSTITTHITPNMFGKGSSLIASSNFL